MHKISFAEATAIRRANLPGPDTDPRIQMSDTQRTAVDATIALRRTEKVVGLWMSGVARVKDHEIFAPVAEALIERRKLSLSDAIEQLELEANGAVAIGQSSLDWASDKADEVLAIYPDSMNPVSGAYMGFLGFPPLPEAPIPTDTDDMIA